jgi:hypothetical protein
MSTGLKQALEALQELPEPAQTTVVERFQQMIARAKIDGRLAQSEARGGETPADAFFAELRAVYGK